MAHCVPVDGCPGTAVKGGSNNQGRRKPTLTVLHTSRLFEKFNAPVLLW